MSAAFSKFFGSFLSNFLKSHPDLGPDVIFLFIVAAIILFTFLAPRLLSDFFVKPFVMASFQGWSSRNLAKFSVGLGYNVRPRKKKWGIIPATSEAETKHNGRAIRFYHIEGKTGAPMMAIAAVCAGPPDFCLNLQPNFGLIINYMLILATFRPKDFRAKEFRLPKSPTNDAAFDEAYVVKSSDTARANSILTPTIRNELLAQRRPSGDAPTVTVGDGEATYAIYPRWGTVARWEKLAEKITLVCALAKQAESRRA
jgi:hypothetical protein